MASPKTPLLRHRDRLRRSGMVRLEVKVKKGDAPLIRSVVSALNDPERESAARTALTRRFQSKGSIDLKALLAAAPLEGVDLSRDEGTARDVDL